MENSNGDKREVDSIGSEGSFKYVVAVLSSLDLFLLGVIIVYLTHPKFESNEPEQEKVTRFASGPMPLVHDDTPTSPPPCLTKECVTMSSDILSKMDFSVSPCQDMYLYACGGLHAKTKFPKMSELDSVVMADKLLKLHVGKIIESNKTQVFGKQSSAVVKMRSFYKTCIDEKSLEEKSIPSIVTVINELGSWTMTNVSVTPFDPKKWSLQETLTKLHKMGFFFFFSVKKVNLTLENTKLKTEIIAFTREDSDFLTFFNFGPTFTDYLIIIAVKLAERLGGDPYYTEAKAEEIMEFFQDLIIEKPNYTIKPMPLKALQEQIGSSLDLKDYLKEMFGDGPISVDTLIECPDMAYFTSLGKALKQHDKSVVANVLVHRFLYEIMNYLPEDMLVPVKIYPRETLCTNSLLSFFAAPLIALYVQDYFKHETKAKVISISENIRKEIVKTFSGVPWMDDRLKEALIRKVQLVEMDPAYPDWILDQATLDKVYEKVEVFPGELLNSVIGMSKESVRQRFHFQPHTPAMSWEYRPLGRYVYFSSRLHSINITIAYLLPPVYSPLLPASYQYGSLGFTFGHEFTHAVDIVRRLVDRDYLPISPSWTASANETFMNGVSCLVDLYSSFEYDDGVRASGYKAINEDVADNEGLSFAYRAYKALAKSNEPSLPGLNLTDDQMFFLAFSQDWCKIEVDGESRDSGGVHNSNRIRVMGTMSNSEEFAKTFSCPPDSPMNPKKKCRLY